MSSTLFTQRNGTHFEILQKQLRLDMWLNAYLLDQQAKLIFSETQRYIVH